MISKKARIFFVALLALAIVAFYSTSNTVEAGKKNTSSGSGWNSWNHDDDSSGGKGHGKYGKSHDDDSSSDDNSSGHKKKKPSKNWLTKGNKNIDHDKHFLGTTDEADLVIKTNNTEKARVTIDGDVGIGTASPTGTLHVNGGIAAADTDGKDVTIEAQDGGPTTGAGGNIVLTPGTDGDGASSGTVYVGEIDTLDPPVLSLDVNGQIRIRGGSPFLGAVLTSDSFGNASWQSVNDADADPTNELQTLSQSGNDVTLSLGGGSVTVADNDNDSSNEFQTLSQVGNSVTLSNGGGTVSVDDGDSNSTNELQSLSSSAAGTNRTIDISSGTGTTINVADNDDDSTNELNTGISFDGTSLTVTDAGGNQTVDISGLADDADPDPTNELNTAANLTGTDLNITDAGSTLTVGLSSLVNDADADPTNERNTAANLTGTDLNITDSGGTLTVGLSSLVDDADADPTNELNTSVALVGSSLEVTDAGGTITTDLSSLGTEVDPEVGGNTLNFMPKWNGTELVTGTIFDNGSKVGIGTTSPGSKLHIGGWIGGGLRTWMDNGVIVGDDSDGGYFGVKDEGPDRKDTVISWGDNIQDNLRFIFTESPGAPNGVEAMRINGAGNVGIGTPTPGAKLDILGDIKIVDGTQGAGEVLTTVSGTGLATWEPIGNDGDWTISGSDMYSAVSGNVGIGTTSPFASLDVRSPNSGDVSAKFLSGDTTNNTAKTGSIDILAGAVNFWANARLTAGHELDGASPHSFLAFATRDSSGNTNEKMRLTSGGNVGIGTLTPGAKLDVAGQVKITGGVPGLGKVLTSDASGLASWETIANDGDWTISGSNMSSAVSGNVGIGTGTTVPESLLTLASTSSNPTLAVTPLTSGLLDPVIELHGELPFAQEGFAIRYDNTIGDVYFNQIYTGITGSTPAMRFSTGNAADAMVISANGNVGIGTNNPSQKLEVLGVTLPRIFVTDTTNNLKVQIQADDTFGWIGTQSAHDFYIGTADAFKVAIQNSTGNVGIGTASPDSKLTLQSLADGSLISVKSSHASNSKIFEVEQFGVDGFLSLRTGSGTTITKLSGYAPTPSFFLSNVGIGTTSPGAKLEVGDGASNIPGYMNIVASDNDGSVGMSVMHGSKALYLFQTATYGKLDAYDYGTNTALDVIIAQNGGNVGIGTTNPTEELEVNGTVKAKAYKTTIYTAGGINSPAVTVPTTSGNNWKQFPDLTTTVTLTETATVSSFYSISMNGPGGFLVTRLVVDNNVVTRTSTGLANYWGNSERWVMDLGPGSHTIKVEYRANVAKVNDPVGSDYNQRLLQVLVLGSS